MLSVIIPTYNRAGYLKDTIESILNQTLNKSLYEIIVIDNGSTDSTRQVIEELNNRHENRIRYFYEPLPGLHNGRHRGAKEAIGDILVFVDDDIVAFPEWLENILSSFKSHPEAVLVGGKCLPKYEIDPPSWGESLWDVNEFGKVNGWLSLVDLGEIVKEIPADYVYGCNFSIRKTILEKCKGFHPDSMPWKLAKYRGDGETHISEFIKQNNLITIYNSLASVCHRVPAERLTKSYFCERAYLQAISYSYSITRKNDNTYKRFIVVMNRIKNIILYDLLLSKKKLKIHWLYYLYSLIWHQICILRDPELLDWIKREDYRELY